MGDERETIRDMIQKARSEEHARNERSDTLQIEIAPLAEQMAHADREGKHPFLVIFDGMSIGSHIPLDERPIVIGRDESCDIVIEDAGISRRHARVHLIERNKLEVFDLGSTNGTYIKGKRISSAVLPLGGKVLLGQRTLARFVMEDQLDRIYQETIWSSCTGDGLTGISNRTYLKKRLVEANAFAKRHQIGYSLILFSVDNLDEICRIFGMQVGDQSLVVAVRVISEIIRTEDVFSRYSRDELAVLSTGCDLIGAKALAERVCKEVAEKQVALPDGSGKTVTISLSAGIATVFRRPELDTSEVLSVATGNLYRAKREKDQPVRIIATHVP